MNTSNTVYTVQDWSRISPNALCSSIESSSIALDGSIDSFGLHRHNGAVWTGQYVGVGRIRLNKGTGSLYHREEVLLNIQPRFGLDPWQMLEIVFKDEEFTDYLEESQNGGDPLFKIYDSQKPIPIDSISAHGGETLLQIGFINTCYWLCRKGLKKALTRGEANLVAKIRGRIDVVKNIRNNTMHGRNDRFYCNYPVFSEDIIENQVLKAALEKCASSLCRDGNMSDELSRRVGYCRHALKSVRSLALTNKSLNSVSATGLYSYYKPCLHQAKQVLSGSIRTPSIDDKDRGKQLYTLPYMINMQLLFELYVRKVLKDELPQDFCVLPYRYSFNVGKGPKGTSALHIMKSLIPDIVISRKGEHRPCMVFDVKYKQADKTSREDTLQLLAYSFSCGMEKCGFVFPGTKSGLRKESVDVLLNSPYVESGVPYFEIYIGLDFSIDSIKRVIGW